jgi:Carboxypeptidase regulatory-like domain/TonB dependent receptor
MNLSRRCGVGEGTGLFRGAGRFLALFFGSLVAPLLLCAQTATVRGTLLDPSGAAVADATITATNVTTGLERTTVSTDTGAYTVGSLPPSVYTFSINKPGFKVVKFENIDLTVDQVLTLDAKLEIGSTSTTIEVASATVAPVDTESATLSNVVEHSQMTELPLILRDPYQLVLLGPGVTQSDSTFGGVSVNGGRERNNNFLLDGVDNNDAQVPGPLGGLTTQNPDSTQEFRVLTNNFAPEYGRNNGAIIDVITRSGTNDFHGNLFYFGRWDALGARDYFNHQIDPNTGVVEPKNPYVRNLYGGSVGGPIKKDRTFFFLNYQGARFITDLTNTSTVPTTAFKTGIFTYTNPGGSAPINVTVPNSNQNATSVGLDPIIHKIFALYPTPNVNNPDGATGLLFFPSESREKDEDATLKIDHKINATNALYARYIFNWFHDPNSGHDDFLPGDLGAVSAYNKIQGLAIGLTTTPGTTFINEFRFGGNRINEGFFCDGVKTFDSVAPQFIDGVGRGADFSFPIFQNSIAGTGFGCQALGDSDGQSNKQGTYQWYDGMTKVVKAHSFKWGAEIRDVYNNGYSGFSSRADFTFNVFTSSQVPTLMNVPAAVANDPTFQFLQDEVGALLGLVNSQSQTQFFNAAGTRMADDELNFRQHEVGAFWEDSWKFKPNLTITYGLRWEWYGVPYEAHNNISNLFQNPSGTGPIFTFQTVGPGSGRQLYNDDYKNFEPRFGFAWDPFKTGRTSVRGGVGVFSDRIYGNLVSDVRGNPPFQPSVFTSPAFDEGPVPAAQLQNLTAPSPLTPSPLVGPNDLIFPDIFERNIRPPLVVTWNLGIQREITHKLVVDANYVGNHGTRILRVVDGNPPQPELIAELLADGVPPSTLQFNTLYQGAQEHALPFNPVNNTAFLHTFTDQTSGHSWYDGLQLQVTEQAFHGLQIQGAYTYSHALDDSSDPLVTTLGNGNYPIDSFDLRREKGNSGFDTRNRGVINFVYRPNIGKGRARLNEGYVGRALEGWEISGIAAWQSGLPYDILGFLDTLHTGLADRATLINPSALKTVPSTGKVLTGGSGVFTGYNLAAFNPEDGSIPIPWGVPSNELRNQFYGPGINNWNAILAKNTKITERVDFQLRFEFYNLFNRVQFAKPDNNIGDVLFGYSTSQVGQNDGTTGARQVQIGAKLNF